MGNSRRTSEDEKILHSQIYTQAGVRKGTRVAGIAGLATVVPTLIAVRTIPYAKANINHTSQALIIATASVAAYFITLNKSLAECVRFRKT